MRMEPLRDRKKIDQIFNYLTERDPKYGILFKLGVNTGLRISDLIRLRVSDIFDENRHFREHLILAEQKTGKEKKIKLNAVIRKHLLNFLEDHPLPYHGFLFYSQKGGHIGRVQAYRLLKEAGCALNVENFGTHSMRKTWGYWTYKMSRYNIGLIMDALNHSDQAVTLRYIGIDQDQKDDLYTLVQL